MRSNQRGLRIFLSSTALDLTAHREKAREAILRLGNLPVAMETFSAQPGVPASECQRMAAEADAVVVLVAHRYGFVPPEELGGDGTRSITWLEVAAARDAGKPVFAFLVDPQAVWNQPKEQDRLETEPDKALEIAERIRRLQQFRRFLASTCIYNTFTSADDLAAKVASALATFDWNTAPQGTWRAREWRPRIMHPLQPARHFQGRGVLLEHLLTWVREPVVPDRVVSLVAVGGTGKTALVQRVLSEARGQVPAGLLVWSFYEDPRTEEFLRVACEYFSGETDTPAGGRLERLQRALAGDEAHLLVLDGLERVQAEGHDGRLRGTLEDPQIKTIAALLGGWTWPSAGIGNLPVSVGRPRAMDRSGVPSVAPR